MGVTGNGGYIFWVTQPSDRPDAWDVAVNQALRAPWYTFAGTLTEFLLAGVELGGIGGGEAPDHDSVRYVGSSGRRRGLEVEHSLVGAHVVERLGQQRQKAFRGFDAVVREWASSAGGRAAGSPARVARPPQATAMARGRVGWSPHDHPVRVAKTCSTSVAGPGAPGRSSG
ncbi:hypothetical protein ACFCZR_10745 [Streptomyces rubiginosohelvolus]|uniref:hypothetical protein n=1 Tax=Streptomyces rubiginosohelvolus TaxID=67362 RepID=UPI0035E0B881